MTNRTITDRDTAPPQFSNVPPTAGTTTGKAVPTVLIHRPGTSEKLRVNASDVSAWAGKGWEVVPEPVAAPPAPEPEPEDDAEPPSPAEALAAGEAGLPPLDDDAAASETPAKTDASPAASKPRKGGPKKA